MNARRLARKGPEMNYSYQRQVVLETLRAQKQHLTAQQLYQIARRSCPRLSLGTVYRNLNTLVASGLAGRVCVPGEADRFDWEPQPHHHFYCRACKATCNLELPTDVLDSALAACGGVRVEGYNLIVTGLCENCQGQV